ncbi:MAG: NAD-binding protein [Cyanobacteria bacterium Co-bin8]|nr:NAD-binding protein [Cyanobacteria bacterium Co-bin8]
MLLRQQGAQVVGISDKPLDIGDSAIVVGNLRSQDTLKAAGIEQAHTLLLASSDDALNLAILTQARLLNPKIRIINRLFNASLGERLDQTLPQHVSMSVAALAGPLFAFAALGNRAIGQIELFGTTWAMHEEYIDADHPWNGRLLKSLWEDRGRMLIYYHSSTAEIDLISAVLEGEVLHTGDRLIVATRPQLQKPRSQPMPYLWRRLLVALNQLRQRSRATLLVLLVLLMTIGGATLTYTRTNLDTSVVDAFYFAVGMITGAGGQEQVAEQASAAVKVFTAVMMLVGAGVIGICYALLNDLVLGAHFQELWSVARLPHHHHYIVCGLGGIGYRIASQLHNSGYEVVVIERDPNGRFIPALRAMKVPVLVGDASVPSVLETVNVQKATALLAVTSDDTVNLEIALTAKGLSPYVSIVVRNQDPDFAYQVQQVFEFEQVMSPTELAAPAFAAAALGGRILGNGMAGGLLWVAIATLITPHHPFCSKSIQSVAKQADLVPLYLETRGQTLHGFALLNAILNSGDILYLTLPAHRLEQLWRHTSLLVSP